MPRDLFGDVTRPSISIGNRKWYTVPVSLFSHAAVLATIVIVPLLAAPMMPGVLSHDGPEWMPTVVPPPPPPPEPIRVIEPPPTHPPIPIDVPTGINPERPQLEPFETTSDGPIILGDIGPGRSEIPAPPPPIAQPQEQSPVRVGFSGVRTPVKTHHVDPSYPQVAQAARIQGIVIIEATISEDGHVANARILRSVPLLDQAAMEAVRQWQFTPTLLNGKPVPVIMTVTVNFTLK